MSEPDEYLKRGIRMVQDAVGKKPGVYEIIVNHKPGCSFNKTGECNCYPDLKMVEHT